MEPAGVGVDACGDVLRFGVDAATGEEKVCVDFMGVAVAGPVVVCPALVGFGLVVIGC